MNPVAGNSVNQQAIRVAGALAELAITELWFGSRSSTPSEEVVDGECDSSSTATNPTVLHARLTDLPGLLTTAPIGSQLFAPSLDLTVHVRPNGLAWSSTNPRHAANFAGAIGPP